MTPRPLGRAFSSRNGRSEPFSSTAVKSSTSNMALSSPAWSVIRSSPLSPWGAPRRPISRRPRAPARSGISVENVEVRAPADLGRSGDQDRADGLSGAAVLADDLADVTVSHAKLDDGVALPVDFRDLHAV